MTRSLCLVAAALLTAAASSAAALEDAQAQARALTDAARAAAAAADVPGVREAVLTFGVNAARTCEGGAAHYALARVSKDYGPSLTAKAATLESSYLYPDRNGLSLSLEGSALSIAADGQAPVALGTLAPEPDEKCRAWGSVTVPFVPAPGVAAVLSTASRGGIFRNRCNRNPVSGFRDLDVWTVLTLNAGGRTMTIRIEDSRAFRDEQSCRDFAARLPRG